MQNNLSRGSTQRNARRNGMKGKEKNCTRVCAQPRRRPPRLLAPAYLMYMYMYLHRYLGLEIVYTVRKKDSGPSGSPFLNSNNPIITSLYVYTVTHAATNRTVTNVQNKPDRTSILLVCLSVGWFNLLCFCSSVLVVRPHTPPIRASLP